MLLERDTQKQSLFVGGMYDQLPIHVACRCNLAPDSIGLLLEYDSDKRTLLQEDNAGRIPLHVAYLRNSHNDVLRLLLQAMICHRIERVGLEQWKGDMRRLLQSMSTHERDFNTSDKLEMTRHAMTELLLERAFVLELILWKASCCLSSASSSSSSPPCPTTTSMQDILDKLSANDNNFDAQEYKQECHIKSGAEMIVPRVLSFLEHEPIDRLLEQF